ncbi:MAG TPA: NAD-binding protein [Streptosporangiaceae bacterium]
MRVVILGAERLGRLLTLDLLDAGHDVRVLEPRGDLLAAFPRGSGARLITGSPLHHATLSDALAGSDAVAAVSSDDCLNAVMALAARQEFRVPAAIAVIGNPRRAEALSGIGAYIICPTARTARDIRLALDRSGVESELVLGDDLGVYRAEVPPRLDGRTFAELARPGELTPLALERAGHVLMAAPELTVSYGDVLHVLARSRDHVADIVRP